MLSLHSSWTWTWARCDQHKVRVPPTGSSVEKRLELVVQRLVISRHGAFYGRFHSLALLVLGRRIAGRRASFYQVHLLAKVQRCRRELDRSPLANLAADLLRRRADGVGEHGERVVVGWAFGLGAHQLEHVDRLGVER